MKILGVLLLLFSLSTATKTQKEIFELDVDEIIDSEIGDVYQARAKLNKIVTDTTDTFDSKTAELKQNYMNLDARRIFKSNTSATALNMVTRAPNNLNVTRPRPRMASIPPEIRAKFMNLTVQEMKTRRMKMQLENIIGKNYTTFSDFVHHGDDFTTLTSKFDKLVEDSKKNEKKPDTRRELYDYGENVDLKWEGKVRLMQNMEHFVYITRYRLIVPQLLRRKYMDTHRYKLGYLFALLRQLSNMQKWVWFALKKWRRGLGTLYFHLKMFEKIVQFDVEIKDITKKIVRLEYQRNMLYNPKHYDYSVESGSGKKDKDALWG